MLCKQRHKMEKRRRCDVCKTNVHRASLAKLLRSRKNLENERYFPSHGVKKLLKLKIMN